MCNVCLLATPGVQCSAEFLGQGFSSWSACRCHCNSSVIVAEPRVNQPPVAIVSPQFQEISLPTISTVIDGSREYLQLHTQYSKLGFCVFPSGLALWIRFRRKWL